MMTAETNSKTDPSSESKLLSPEERAILSQIAAQDPPFSQRAQALLTIDQGATQSAAGQEAGLSLGQVRYWLGKFRKGRLSIFPAEMLQPAQKEEIAAPQDKAKPLPVPDTPDPEPVVIEEEVEQEMVEIKETTVPVNEAPTPPASPPEEKKKSKKKAGKPKKTKKEKKKKKDKKGQKPKKKSKEDKPQKKKKGKKGKKKDKKKKAKKEKDAKSKPGKKKKKKGKK
jgi:hypothetical protein